MSTIASASKTLAFDNVHRSPQQKKTGAPRDGLNTHGKTVDTPLPEKKTLVLQKCMVFFCFAEFAADATANPI